MRLGWLIAVILMALAVLAISGIYFYVFEPLSGGHLSHDPEEWAHFGEYVGGAFGALAFIGVLITMTLQREQLKEQVDTSRRQLRAYVFVESTRIEGLQVNSRPVAEIRFKNYGQTPAYNVTSAVGVAITHESDAQLGGALVVTPIGSLGPGGTFAFKTVTEPPLPIITEAYFKLLNEGALTLFVYGTIRFDDAFGNKDRFLNFRVKTVGNFDQTAGQLFSCDQGNETDPPD